MAKYSTGGSSGSGDGGACELCGATSESLRTAKVAGATLDVCPDCRPHDDNAHKDKKQRRKQGGGSDSGSTGSSSTTPESSGPQTGGESMWDGDTSHWEEGGTDYDDDQLPYLVRGYGETVESARQDAGLQREELAEELDVAESDLLAVEQNRAVESGIGGSLIEAIEERLDVELVDE